ncbi:MAG: hypothetical protein HPY45_08240 [Anaerolineae bacterium]|nr:hypothetical protein [Anaerolineae bacterium]
MSEQVVWVDADGVQTSLHSGSILSLIDRIGDTVPPYETLMEEVPGEAGGRVRLVKVKMREIQLPIVVRESSRAALVATLRTLAYALNPYRGEGVLDCSGG